MKNKVMTTQTINTHVEKKLFSESWLDSFINSKVRFLQKVIVVYFIAMFVSCRVKIPNFRIIGLNSSNL